jgi:hypothetical protein
LSKKAKPQLERKQADLSIIKCICGAEILLVPDLKAMTEAIETHALAHGKKYKTPNGAASEVERILMLLIVQVLGKTSKS